MTCNNLNDLNNCAEMSVVGVKSVTLYPFGNLYNYSYTADNLNKITNYQQLSIGAIYKTNTDSTLSFDSTLSVVNQFNHNLKLSMSKLAEEKRNEFEKLLEMPLSAIVEDRNGRTWLLGQEEPLQLTEYSGSTAGNDYNLNFNYTCRNQMREIISINELCLINFTGEDYFSSTFTFIAASTLNFTGLYQLIQNINGVQSILSVTPTALEPLLWPSDPIILARDTATLNSLINNTNTSITTISYDAVTDIAIIVLESSNAQYPNLFIDVDNYAADIEALLNLTILSGALQTGATITVTDGLMNVLYTGALTDAVVGVGLSGTVQDAWINVSLLYPAGQTFTAEITGTSCPDSDYTYILPALIGCFNEVENGLYYGYNYYLVYPKSYGNQAYKHIQIQVDGIILSFYETSDLWHNSDAQFAADLQDAFNDYPYTNVDPTSLEVLDFGPMIVIKFRSAINDETVPCYLYQYNVLNTQSGEGVRVQAIVAAVNSLVPSTSTINITDGLLNLDGTYGSAPTTNTGFFIDDIPTITDGNIESIGISLLDYPETQSFDVSYDGMSVCPSGTVSFVPSNTFNSVDKTIYAKYYRFEAAAVNLPDNLGTTFTITISGATQTLSWTNNLTTHSISECSEAFRDALGIYPISIKFDGARQTWIFELMCDPTDTIDSFYIDSLVVFAADVEHYFIWKYNVLPVLNPDVEIQVNMPTIDGAFMQDYSKSIIGEVKAQSRRSYSDFGSFINVSAGTFDVSLLMNNTMNDTFTFYFYAAIPETANELISYTIATPTLLGSFDIQTDLGAAYNTIKFIRVKDAYAIDIAFAWTPLESDVSIALDVQLIYKKVFGSSGRFYALYTRETADLANPFMQHSCGIDIISVVHPEVVPENPTLWFRTNDIDPNILNYTLSTGDTLTIVQGSNLATLTGLTTDMKEGMWIKLVSATATNVYIVQSIIGTAVILNTDIIEPSATVSIYNGYIQSITDRSPSAIVIDQVDGTKQAYLKVNQLNDFNAITFDGDDAFKLTPLLFANPTEISILAVVRNNGTTGTIFSHGELPNVIQLKLNGTDLIAYAEDAAAATVSHTVTTPVGYTLVYFRFNHTIGTTTLSLGVNGATPTSTSGVTANTFAATAESIGSDWNGVTWVNGMDGDIIEFLAFDDLSITDRQFNEGVLAWRNNLQSFLPMGHPYKNNRPI